jgi:hypothetical protein
MSQSTPASSSRRRPKRAAKTTRRTNAAKRTRRAKDQSDTVEANAAPRRESPSHLEDLGLPPEPKSKRRLNEIAESLLGVRFPDRALCPQHHSPMDYLYKSFVEQKDLLVWANRGGGKTMLAAAATLLDALYRAPVKIRILGGSFDQSDRLADYVREFVQRRPELVAAPMRKDRVGVVGGSEIRMLAQSQRAVRGQHVQKIRCDEVDLFDADVWQAVQFATRSREETRGSIEVLSTLHRQGGLMHDLVEEARNTDAAQSFGYHLVSWCLWEVIERCHPRRRCDDCLLEEDCQGIARRAAGFSPSTMPSPSRLAAAGRHGKPRCSAAVRNAGTWSSESSTRRCMFGRWSFARTGRCIARSTSATRLRWCACGCSSRPMARCM